MAQQAVSVGEGLHIDTAAHDAGQRALRAAFFGFFVDMFDVYLPVVALGPAMSYFQPATLSPALKSTLFYVVFALVLGRPSGGSNGLWPLRRQARPAKSHDYFHGWLRGGDSAHWIVTGL